MGDSWVEDLNQYEKEELFLTSYLNKKAKNLRIMGASSWSPLIMNLIFRQKLMNMMKSPIFLLFF